MTVGRHWTPKGCCWKRGCIRSPPASSGWSKKGGAEAVEPPARTAVPRLGEDGRNVPRGAGGIRLPQGSGQDPQQPRREEGQAGAPAAARPVDRDASGGQAGPKDQAGEAGEGTG